MFRIKDNKITLTRGDSAIFDITAKCQDGSDYAFSEEDQVVFTLRRSPAAGDIYMQKTGTHIEIEPEDTAKMSFGHYYYDVQLTQPDGTVDTIIVPTSFELAEEVTY